MNEYIDVFELIDDMNEIIDFIAHGEETEEDLENLKELEISLNEKVSNFVAKIKNLTASRDAVKIQRESLQAKEQSLSRQIDRLEKFVFFLLQSTDTKKAGDAVHSAQRNKKRPVINILDEDRVPDQFARVVTTRKIDKRELYNWFKNTGEIVEGTEVLTGEEYLKIS